MNTLGFKLIINLIIFISLSCNQISGLEDVDFANMDADTGAPDSSNSGILRPTRLEDSEKSKEPGLNVLDTSLDASLERDSDDTKISLEPNDGGTDVKEPKETSSDSCIEGELRCLGSLAREICRDNQFVETTSCGKGEVCVSGGGDQPGTCKSAHDLCDGSANSSKCIGADLYICGSDGTVAQTETCESERHCQAGESKNRCALCLPGTFKCEERQLLICDSENLDWQKKELCNTVNLCNASAGACTDKACLAGGKTCQGVNLMICNKDQTSWELLTQCGPDLCDPVDLECDLCLPGTNECNLAGDGYRVCDKDGQKYGEPDITCDPLVPHCIDGTCHECIDDGHCTNENPCLEAACRVGSCATLKVPSGTGSCVPATASSGVCDGDGGCVECTKPNHCATNYCV